MEPTKKDFRAVGNRTQQILTRANGESTVRPFGSLSLSKVSMTTHVELSGAYQNSVLS